MSRNRKIVIAAVAVVVLAVGGVFGWLLFIRDDAPPALNSGDLADALDNSDVTTIVSTDDTTLVSTPAAAGSDAPQATTAATPATPATANSAGTDGTDAGGSTGDVTGAWAISSDSTLGYRVQEVLSGIDTEGAGRTNQVTGTLTIEGTSVVAAEFTVQMASITSDSDRRDGQFRNRIMSTDDFPISTFVLTAPIDFGEIPAEGTPITATATGDLTLRGVTNSVTFDIEAQITGGRIGVLGNIPVLFSEYEIPDPSNAIATVKDNGLLEFVLVFDRT